jgi:hypothetical protein
VCIWDLNKITYKYREEDDYMALSFTSPVGFRFFCLMNMITITVLALAKSLVDQLPDQVAFARFTAINLIGFFLFVVSLIYGKKISKPRHQWFNNAFLVSGIVLLSYGSTIEVQGAIHSSYLPIFYLVEIFVLLVIGNKIKLENAEGSYNEMVNFRTES